MRLFSRLFHRHHWHVIRRKVVRGALEQGRAFKAYGGLWNDAALDAFYGYTVIEQECKDCGLRRVRKFTGTVEGN